MAAELEVGIGVDLKDLNEGLKRATSKFQEFGSKMESIGSMMSLAITAPLVLLSKQMIKLASDSEESTNKVNVAFGKSSDAIKQFASTSLTQFGIAKSEAMDMAATYGDMSTSMGLSQQQAAQLSTSLVALGGDLASFKNIGIDQANTALKGIFTGETESLKMLGIVMTEANLKAYALSKGFKGNYEDLTQSEKVLLRYNYVMANTTNAQGDFARTGGGAANQMRVFQGTLKEIGETFGSVILPYFTKAITYVNNLMKAFIGLDSNVKTAILAIGGIAAVAGPLTFIIGKVIDLGGYLKYLVTPVGLFGVAMAATAYYVIKEWDKVRGFFYDLEVSFFKFKQNLGGGLFAMGLIDAETAFGDFAEGFSKISRWSKTSTDGIKKFTDTIKNGFTNVKGLLDFTGHTGGGKEKGKSSDKPKTIFSGLADSLFDVKENKETPLEKWIKEKREATQKALKESSEALGKNAKQLGENVSVSISEGLSYASPLGKDIARIARKLKIDISDGISAVEADLLMAAYEVGQRIGVTLADGVKQAISVGLDFISDTIQNAFKKGEDKLTAKQLFGGLLNAVGDLMVTLGKQLVLISIALDAIKNPFTSAVAGVALGIGLIAAGAALKGIGGGMSQDISSGAKNIIPTQPRGYGQMQTVEVRFANGALKGYIDNRDKKYNG